MRAQHSVKKQTTTAILGCAKPKDRGTPKGYCFKFHRGMECVANCAFKHLCYKCEGSHPVSRCNFRGQNRTSANCPLPANPNLKNRNLPTPVIILFIYLMIFFLSPSLVLYARLS